MLGICNGFQVLCEAGLLPGALLRNEDLRFVCRQVDLIAEGSAAVDDPEGISAKRDRLSIPVKHGEGRYCAPEEMLDGSRRDGQVAYRYAPGQNPNGSVPRHRRGQQRGRQRARPDAASGARGRPADRIDGRPAESSKARDARGCPPRSGRHPLTASEQPPAAPRAGADRLRVRADRREARPRAERRRAGDVQPALVRALRLQALAQAAAAAADRGRAGGDGAGRERRRRRRRQRLRGRLQGRVPQPPERGRALPGRGDRGRRHPPRRLRARARGRSRSSTRCASASSTRSARASCSTARCAGSATTATRSGWPTVGGEIYFEAPYEHNCLVNAMCVGLAPRPRTWSAPRRPGSATRSS